MDHLLTLILLLPVIGAIAVLLTRRESVARWVALGITLGTFALSLLLLIFFDWHKGTTYAYGSSMQLVATRSTQSDFKVGIDGLSLPLIWVTSFITIVATIASWNIPKRQRGFLAFLLLLESGILGVFLSLDLIRFYAFFEISLLPICFLTGIWGGPRRKTAIIKFVVFSLAGSIALLVAILQIHRYARNLDLIQLAQPVMQAKLAAAMGGLSGTTAETIFILLIAGFLLRLPSVPFHGWVTDLHLQSPVPVSMMLAAALPMMGGYGILRVALPLFPQVAKSLWLPLVILGILGLIFGGLCALVQTDFKRLVTYSRVSQIGPIVLGAAMLTPAGANGALFMMIANGISSAMLFFIVGVIDDRKHRLDLHHLGRIATTMPTYTGLSLLGLFANLGLPGLCGFVGQILVLIGTFQAARPDGILYKHALANGTIGGFVTTVLTLAALVCVNVFITAGYTLRAIQRVFFASQVPQSITPRDLDRREISVLTPLAVLAVALGVVPGVLIFSLANTTMAAIMKLF